MKWNGMKRRWYLAIAPESSRVANRQKPLKIGEESGLYVSRLNGQASVGFFYTRDKCLVPRIVSTGQ